MSSHVEEKSWQKTNLQFFWNEVANSDHVVQIYENDKVFLDTLEGFVGSGLLAGDTVVIIATSEHISMLNNRLHRQGFNLDGLIESSRYITLDASETLSGFMVNGWPDENLFNRFISAVLRTAQTHNRKVRAFGEMVALLWSDGFNEAAIQLENLWNRLLQQESFTLFCAYPKMGFTRDAENSMQTICCSHSKVIDGAAGPSTEINFQVT